MLALLMLLALPAVAQAQFIYTTNNGTISMAGYTGSVGAPGEGRESQTAASRGQSFPSRKGGPFSCAGAKALAIT
jgi:hypothetical protein